VYLSGGSTVVFLGIGFASGFASGTAGSVFWALALVSFITLPFFFVGGLLRGRFARAGLQLLRDAPAEPTPSEAEASLRRALNDPTLRLSYWLEDTGCHVDTAGNRFELRRPPDGRMTTSIEYEGRPLAAIEYDASLRHEPELLEEVLATTRLALEKDRSLQALRRSEARSRAVLNALPDTMIRTDRDGTYLDVQG